MKKRKLFCEISPVCYRISLQKEYLLRDLHDRFSGEKFAREINTLPLPEVVKSHTSPILRHLEGVDMELQRNKAYNLAACLCENQRYHAAPRGNILVLAPGRQAGREAGLPRWTCDKRREAR